MSSVRTALLEGDEIFYVQVTGHDGDAFIADDTDGEATIKNTCGSDVIFAVGFEQAIVRRQRGNTSPCRCRGVLAR